MSSKITNTSLVSHTCSMCLKTATKKCSRCKDIFYCSLECQTKDWPSHKPKCLSPTRVQVSSSSDFIPSAQQAIGISSQPIEQRLTEENKNHPEIAEIVEKGSEIYTLIAIPKDRPIHTLKNTPARQLLISLELQRKLNTDLRTYELSSMPDFNIPEIICLEEHSILDNRFNCSDYIFSKKPWFSTVQKKCFFANYPDVSVLLEKYNFQPEGLPKKEML